MTTAFQKVSWKRRVRKSVLIRPKGIAATSHGLDEGLLGVAIDLFAQSVDVDLDDVGLALPVGLPEVLAEHAAGDDGAGVSHQELEEAELGGGEVDVLAGASDLAGGEIEDEIGDGDGGGGPVGDPATDGL